MQDSGQETHSLNDANISFLRVVLGTNNAPIKVLETIMKAITLILLILTSHAYAIKLIDGPKSASEIETFNHYNTSLGLHKATSLRRLPYMKSNYIPQGVYITKTGSAYKSMYHKDARGIKSKPSIVSRYSVNTNKLERTYFLYKSKKTPYMGHVGGLAISGKYIIVTHGKYIYFFNKNTAKRIKSNQYRAYYSHRKKLFFGSSKFTSAVSFLNIAKDHTGKNVLWTGEFKKNNTAMHIFGYYISAGKVSTKPKYRFYVPARIQNVQGVTLKKASKQQYQVLLATSYGDKPSYIYKITYNYHKPYYYKYKYLKTEIVFKGPAGAENLHATTTGVWTLFEAGANYFQKRKKSPWRDNFPFLIRLKKSSL